ncbi:MAG: ubiquinol-cytochrome c reductase cytochrome b subunit [Schumannella sp.]|nr:ubiquinol-cytochrome c reductase cytochrome b subunit [Schumannella sp.]
MSLTARLERALDTAGWTKAIQRSAPTHWTGMFGVVTMASVAVLFVTGVVLMFFYAPSSERVVYSGVYGPLHGMEVSKAFASTLTVSLDVPGGLLIRQAHHWAALLLPASIIMQLLATFFIGGFRGSRVWMWALLFLTLIVALAGGWSGYALPVDMLSGTGLRIVEGIMLGIPIAGAWLAGLLFGGAFPGRIIENLYPIHLLVGVALIAVLAALVRGGRACEPLRMPGPARGVRVTTPRRTVGLFVAVGVILTGMAALVPVSPIWLYGPSDPGNVSAGSQPDWYTGFLDGALRLVPPGWEIEIGGYTVTLAVLVPLAVVGVFLAAIVAYPFVENWVTRDRAGGDSLDRPRDVPTRTGIGVAGMAFYGVLWGAASSDVLATTFRLSLESVIVAFQVLLIVAPVLAFSVARRICFGLQRRDRELLAHGRETGRIVRMPGGEYIDVHRQVDDAEVAALTSAGYAPLMLRPDRKGRITLASRLRVALSRVLFGSRIAPVTGSIGTLEGRRDAA